MAVNRTEVLKAMLANDPDNSFARYGLAQEYVRAGEFTQAIAEFATILEKDPTYQAAYYHAGQTYEKMGEPARAKELYEQGIAVAAASGDSHAEGELQAALDGLG